MHGGEFDATMNTSETWMAYENVVNDFLGNHKYPVSKNIEATLLDNYQKFGCNMSM